jgi:cell division transport system permease protein
MKAWLRQHRFALGDAIGRLRRMPGNFLFNVLVVALALALPFAGLTVLENVRPLSDQFAVEPEISIFMASDTPRERAKALSADIRRIVQENSVAAKLEFVPRENALGMLKNKTGLSDAVTTLGTNPLPDAYVLKLANFRDAKDAARVDTVAARLKTLPGVEYVQVDSAWIKRLAALMNVARLALLLLAMMIGMVVVAVVFNTIRLQVMTQHEEIEVSRLVGATDAFVCRPFYYSGALLGLCAGGLALCFVVLMLQPFNAAIAELARLYASEFRLAPPGFGGVTLMLAVSALLGLFGAILSVRRHLSHI